MAPETTPSGRLFPVVFSSFLPGLGQASKGQARRAALIGVVMAVLLGTTVWIGWAGRVDAAIFFFTLLVLPCWVFQAYDAAQFVSTTDVSFRHTWQRVWRQAHDIRYLGGLFLLSAAMDLYIILAQPGYALTVFCSRPEGLPGLLAKAQSPTFHTLIGIGFLGLRKWGLLVYLLYAGFGLANATANMFCFGYGRIRTVFLITLVAFTAYVWWRRACFQSRPPAATPL